MWVNYQGIRVSDVDQSVRFDRGRFGLDELGRGTSAPLADEDTVRLQDSNSEFRVELNWYPDGTQFASRYVPVLGRDHFGLRAEGLHAVVELRSKAGYPPIDLRPYRSDPVHTSPSHMTMAFLQDPNGAWLDLYYDRASADRTSPDGY